MFDFLKGILTKKEPEKLEIPFEHIPAWLDNCEEQARGKLNTITEEPVRKIRNAAAELQLVVNNISQAEKNEELHPKIKSVAKNSLPLFVKAMNASLARELPDDREKFYLSAVECVKGCVNNMRGQGRYLQIVLPDEMKMVKTGIDTMGREINSLTAALATYRNTMGLIEASRSQYDTINSLKTDLGRSGEKDARTDKRIAELAARIEAIDKELAELGTSEAKQEISRQQEELLRLEEARDNAIRHYAALSMTASHVLRKAEKIVQKQHKKTETDALRMAMDLLSDHATPDIPELEGALQRACPIADNLIGAGEIPLKNKEERAIFADTVSFCTDICTAASDVRARESEFVAAEERLAADPYIARTNSLEREKTQVRVMLDKETRNRQDLEEWRAKARAEIPLLLEDLTKKIGMMAGENTDVRISGT